MFNVITKTSYPSYAEEGQMNPLRWAILSFNKKDGTMTQESNWIKCKDFFNDYVFTLQTGKPLSIYGFSASGMSMPTKGESMFFELKGLTGEFQNNLDVLNDWLENEQGMPKIPTIHSKNGLIIELKAPYLTNTHHISLISLVLRIINTDVHLETFEAIANHKPQGSDSSKWGQVVAKNIFFKIPEQLKKYVWYVNESYNSDVDVPSYQLASLVHNNGVLSWSSNW